MIQSGIERLAMAKTSAARNNIPEMIVNLSIFGFRLIDNWRLIISSKHGYSTAYLRATLGQL